MRRSSRLKCLPTPMPPERALEAPMEPFDRLEAQGAMIERLTADSRRCAPGTAFFAYPGEKADGRHYISDALARGAAAVLWEADGFQWRNEWRIPRSEEHTSELQS